LADQSRISVISALNSSSGAAGSTKRVLPTSLPFANSCPDQPAARSGSVLASCAAGLTGGIAAWLGLTTPSPLAMILFGYGVTQVGDLSHAAWLHSLKIVAVAVIA